MATRPATLRTALAKHPGWGLALRAAVAVGLAWWVVRLIGGVAAEYPYYAPLGAVVAMSTTVVSSLRTSAQAVGAIVVGAALALATWPLPLPEVASLVLAVAAGVLVAGWSGWDGMGTWVPITAVFVLLLGGSDPWHYVLAYAGLTALGAAIGTALNVAVPQLPLTPATRAQERLRRELVQQLRDLAGVLESGERPDPRRWSGVIGGSTERARHLDRLVTRARQARRGNWRARRWGGVVDLRERQAKALERIAGLVAETSTMVADPDNPLHASSRDSSLRCRVASAMHATALVLDSHPGGVGEDRPDTSLEAARDALAALRRAALDDGDRGDDERLSVAEVATALERALRAWD